MIRPHTEHLPPFSLRLAAFQFAVSIPILLTIPVLAAALTAMLASPLASIVPGHSWWEWLVFAAAGPMLYAVWLLLVLTLCAVDVQTRRWYRGLRKLPRVTSAEGVTKFFPVLSLYLRARFLYSLPLVEAFLVVPGLRWLVLWSYSTSASIGPQSYVMGMIFDPDLTDIGAGAIIGSGSSVVAHSMTTSPDGTMVLVTARIVIGPRAVIGGASLIPLGAMIGEDAIIEPLSVVAPYTQIPAGEVWGGHPAVFRRRRFESCLAAPILNVISPQVVAGNVPERDICHAVASALNLASNLVSSAMTADDSPAWDSLGQMAIAAALYNLTGCGIPTAQCFQLRSVAQIIAYFNSQSDRHNHHAVESLPANAELLPLLAHGAATRLLAQRGIEAGDHLHLQPVRVLVAATFTAEPLFASLKLWSNAFGIPVQSESTGFDQIPQALLSPESSFRRNITGINVVLTRPEDLLSGPGDQSEQILSAIVQFAGEFPNLLLVASLPPVVAPDCTTERNEVESLRRRWEKSIWEIEGIQVLDFARIVEQFGTLVSANPEGDRIAGIPYTADIYKELGIAIARQVRVRRRAPAKVLALDADGVLWGGVLGEDGFDGIGLGSDGSNRHFQLFQKAILRLKNQGVLLAVVSRNVLADVREVFERHPGMILRSEDIAAWRINWQAKSQNLREIAAELNVGLDSIVFVDDDPANQLEVQAALPEVTVLPLLSDPSQFALTLKRLWCFDALTATGVDAGRTQMVVHEQERKKVREHSIDLESYLASLELRVTMRAATAADMSRVAQLTQKTNQFNLSLKRRSEAELNSLSSEYSIDVVEATDRLGDYGLVGVCILKGLSTTSERTEIDTLLLSCRAFGRYIEDAILYRILELARARGKKCLEAELVVGPRNQPIVDFLQRVGFSVSGSKRFLLLIDADLSTPRHIAWVGPLAGNVSVPQC